MGEKWTAAYHPYYKVYCDLVLCLEKVIEQKQISEWCANLDNDPYMTGNAFPITPTLHYSFGSRPKLNHLGYDS